MGSDHRCRYRLRLQYLAYTFGALYITFHGCGLPDEFYSSLVIVILGIVVGSIAVTRSSCKIAPALSTDVKYYSPKLIILLVGAFI